MAQPFRWFVLWSGGSGLVGNSACGPWKRRFSPGDNNLGSIMGPCSGKEILSLITFILVWFELGGSDLVGYSYVSQTHQAWKRRFSPGET